MHYEKRCFVDIGMVYIVQKKPVYYEHYLISKTEFRFCEGRKLLNNISGDVETLHSPLLFPLKGTLEES